MAKLTQRDKVLRFMAAHHGFITSMDGSDATLQMVDVRKNISDLRKLGYPITDTWETSVNNVRYKLYHLEEWQDYAREFADG